MFGLIFLMLDMSLALFIKSTLQEAARMGVRFVVTDQTLAGDSYLDDSIVKVVQDNALGFLNGPSGACKVSVSYYNPNGGTVSTAGGGYIVEVAIRGVQYTPLAAIFKDSAPVTVNVQATDVMESCPLAGCPAAVNPTPQPCS
jgi:hypothetical protein